ncbi:MAG TPA: DUF6632 domain-containing protein [Longimicrobium sp.]
MAARPARVPADGSGALHDARSLLLLAAQDPLRHLSLIWFTLWSSMAHGAAMAWHALRDPAERGHPPGDVLGLALLAVLTWRRRPGSTRVAARPHAPGTA